MRKSETTPDAKHVVPVIDDDAITRSSLKFALEIEGFAVRLYADAYELLNDTHLPAKSCLLIDYYMPAMNGLEAAAVVHRESPGTGIVVYSAFLTDEAKEMAQAMGASACLDKLTPISDVVEALVQAAESSAD